MILVLMIVVRISEKEIINIKDSISGIAYQ